MSQTDHPARHRSLHAEMVTTARGPLEVARVGEGPPVLVVHGTPGSWRQAVPLAMDLAADHTVLLPSRPGYGRTPLATGRTPAEQAAAYAALLDALGFERAGMLGISGGGPSAAAFAAVHPDRTSALVLCCALAPHLMTPPAGMRRALAVPGLADVAAPVARWHRRRLLARPEAIERLSGEGLSAAERVRAAVDQQLRADLVGFLWSHLDAPPGLAGMRNDLASMGFGPDGRPPDLSGVRAPTTVLHGDADQVVEPAHGSFYAAAVPGAELHVFEGAGHAFLLTFRSEAVVRVRQALRVSTQR